MSINQLIAQGGRGIKSPAERFLETKQQMDQARSRQVQEQSMMQSMDIRGEQEKRAKAEQAIKNLAPMAKTLLSVPEQERPAIYQQLLPEVRKFSQVQVPDEYTSELEPTLNALMERGGLSLDERYEQVYKDGQPVSQREVTSNKYVTHPEAPDKVITGTPEDFMDDKDLVKLTEKRRINEQTLYKSIHGMNRLEKLVSSDDFVGGITGDAVSTINSLTSQVEQIMGMDSILDENNNIRESEIDPNSNQFSSLRKKAIQGDKYSAALIEMAYVKAKLVDPASKITDKDFEFARKMLASGADKASIINTLRMQRKMAAENYNQEEQTAKGRFSKYTPSPYSDEKYRRLYNVNPPMQLDENSTPDDFADDWINNF